jgi:hypothetical protein
VWLHVTFLKVGEINTMKEVFDADILLRSRWREPELDKSKVSKPCRFSVTKCKTVIIVPILHSL